jgi:deoxyribonuclease-4
LYEYLRGFGLNGFEIQCGRGVKISAVAYDVLPSFARDGLNLSLHAPYFISLSSIEHEKRVKSVDYIMQSAVAANRVGAGRVIVHAGSCAKISRGQALEYAIETLKAARIALDNAGYDNILICPETMGKENQLGTLDEVLTMCEEVGRGMLPCIDFGHLNARTRGGIKTRGHYAAVFDEVKRKLGVAALHKCHIHFSKIEYTKGGEKKHLKFADENADLFGPDYQPMLDEIIERKMCPFIVCESDGTQAEDCAVMADYCKNKRSVKL